MRVRAVFKPTDYPGDPDQKLRADVAAMFQKLAPATGAFDTFHVGLAVTAQNPLLATQLAAVSRTLLVESGWGHRPLLRELAIVAVNDWFESSYSIKARWTHTEAAGISRAQVEALKTWRTSELFDDEQKLVLEFVEAVAGGMVPADLFDQVKSRFGEKDAIELSAIIGLWSAWAMIINATCPDFEP